jgi:hypothetical protein
VYSPSSVLCADSGEGNASLNVPIQSGATADEGPEASMSSGEGGSSDAFDEDAFVNALAADKDPEGDEHDEPQGELLTSKRKTQRRKKEAQVGAGNRCSPKVTAKTLTQSVKQVQKKKKRKQSSDVLASYDQYAHLLDQYDQVNKQEPSVDGARESKKRRKGH